MIQITILYDKNMAHYPNKPELLTLDAGRSGYFPFGITMLFLFRVASLFLPRA